MQGEGDCSDGSLFSLRCDWHSWCRPAPCLPHTGFHNEWPGMDTTRSPPPALLVGTAWLDFMGWSQRRAAHSRVMPSTGPSLPRVTTFCFWFDSIELLSGCIICKICMMWGTEGTRRYLFKPSRCPVAELSSGQEAWEATQQRDLGPPPSRPLSRSQASACYCTFLTLCD